jgi:hypothetical protein
MAGGDGVRPTRVRKRLGALAIVLLMVPFVYVVPATHIHAQSIAGDIVVTLTASEIVSISLPKEIERSAFGFDGGQFQVLIPKERFPIPAPNCNKNVIFRMPGVPHEDPSRSAKLDARWDLFQSLYAVKEGKKESILMYVGSGPYMKTKKDGTRELEYCNAFIKLK